MGGGIPEDCIVSFANTGEEDEKTLEFVKRVGDEWGIPIRWVEYIRDLNAPTVIPRQGQDWIGCHGWKEVTFETASRNGEPFDAIIDVKADYRAESKDEPPILPNPTDRWCTGELKHRTMDRLMRSLGYDAYDVIVGIRHDEPKREKKLKMQGSSKIKYRAPLFDAKVDRKQVMAFWRKQPFDLGLQDDPELGTYEGNCVLCFLKGAKKMKRLLDERPELFDRWAERERRTGQTFRRDRATYQQLADKRVSLQMCGGGLFDDIDDCICSDF